MFSGAKSFNQPLSDWRVDKVTDIGWMLALVSPLSDRVDKVTDMSRMFSGASSFNQPLSDWRVDKVTGQLDVHHLVVRPTAGRLLSLGPCSKVKFTRACPAPRNTEHVSQLRSGSVLGQRSGVQHPYAHRALVLLDRER